MNIKIQNRYLTAVLLLICSVYLDAQNYGALEYMLQKRPANERFKSNKLGEHIFFSGAMGPYSLLTNKENQDGAGFVSNFSVGKWITPVHGIRLGVDLGILPVKLYRGDAKMAGGSLDYLLNMSSLTFGYNPKRRFEMLGIVGVETGHSKVADDGIDYYGLHMGLQGNLRISRTVGLFIEPKMGWYNDSFAHAESWRNYKMGGSIMAGLTYTPTPDIENKPRTSSSEKDEFLNKLFISSSGGAGVLGLSGLDNTLEGMGGQLSIGVGKWLSLTSGLRLSGTIGFTKAPEESKRKYLKYAYLHLDYLFDIHNAIWGYNKNRFFTLVGIAGVNMARTKGIDSTQTQTSKYMPGIGIGLQANFRINRSVDLFVEPRFNMYTSKYAGGVGFGNNDQTSELNIGLTYHMLNRTLRSKNEFKNASITDHLFMTTGIGTQLFMSMKNVDRDYAWGPLMSASVGKWLSPYSGLRLGVMGGVFYNHATFSKDTRHVSASGGVDYLWNITSSMSGYDPNRSFELIGSIGANLAFTSKSDQKARIGINAGIQGLWHLNDFWGLYVEPQIRIYGNKFIEGNTDFIKKDMVVSINAGLHYRFGTYSKANNHSVFEKEDKRYFLSAGAGVNNIVLTNIQLMDNADLETKISFGKWYTPLSAWRVNGTILYTPNASRKYPLHYVGLGLDYMMSLATLSKGYNPDRLLDVIPFVGFTSGIVRRNNESKFIPGIDAGAQFKFKVSPSIDLFAEPRVGLRTDSYDGMKQDRLDRVISITGGISYRFKLPKIKIVK